MRTIIAPLALLAFCGLAGSASAASPVYCALYAKEYARQATAESQGSLSPARVHDRAYSKCLNMDDEPPFPTAYTDPDADSMGGVGGPFVEEGSVAAATEVAAAQDPVEEAALIEPETTTAPKKAGKKRGSGFAVGSAEWKNWCQEHFPNSFDPESGTIIPSATGKRTACY